MTTKTPRTEPQPTRWFLKLVTEGFHILLVFFLSLSSLTQAARLIYAKTSTRLG